MSERHPDYTDKHFTRRSPEFAVRVGGSVLNIDWYNTLVRSYKRPFQAMSHLEHTVDNTRLMIFSEEGGDDHRLVALMGQGFPVRLDSEPTDRVAEFFVEYQADGLHKEIEELGGEA